METIREFIQNEPFFETHNHQYGYSAHDWSNINYREFREYAACDMIVAAGIESFDCLSDEKFFQLWQFVRTTGYGEAVELGVRKLFDLDYTLENVGLINQKLQEFVADRTSAEIYADLFSLANITGTVNDIVPIADLSITLRMNHEEFPDFFRFAVRLEELQVVDNPKEIHDIEAQLNCSITTLSALERAVEKLIDRGNASGNVRALKIGLAYRRSLDFDIPTLADAEKAFANLMSGKKDSLKPLHDHLFHHYMRCARERNLVVQIHTGYLNGTYSDLRQGNPESLIPIFIQYPDLRFDLFHAAWPWSELLGAIGKHFPNVWLDMCWAWTMNPIQMERILNEWLSAVPSNKILAYGSDTLSPFPVIGYAQQARNGIASTLEKKILRGEYSKKTAQFVASRIMHENARELYK